MRIDPFLLLPLRQAATLYLAVRLAATIPLWFAEESVQELAGVLIGMGVVGCTVLLSAIDQRRNGAPDLYANLGVSRGRLALREPGTAQPRETPVFRHNAPDAGWRCGRC